MPATNKIFLGLIAIFLIIGAAVFFGFREFSQINNQLASLQEQVTPFLEKSSVEPIEEPFVEPVVPATSTPDGEEPLSAEAPLSGTEAGEEEINICESLNCNAQDGWNNSGSTFICQSSKNETCTCQTQAYFDYSCSTLKQKCVYSTTNTRTNKYNCAAATYPDLIFQSPSFSPAPPNAGDDMSFWAALKNQGSAPAASSLSYLKIDGQKIAESSTASLAGSESIVVAWSTNWPATAGSHELEVCADGGLLVAESNETNNCAKKTFTVGGVAVPEGDTVLLPDLIIESIDFSPDPLVSGQLVNFSATVKNRGNASARASLTVLTLDLGNDGSLNQFPGAKSTKSIAADGSITEIWREAWVSISGTHKIEICADAVSEPELRMAESNETNNCLSKIITVP